MESINLELKFFLTSVFWGILLLLIYDGVRIFRRIVRHNKTAEWLEDLLFWIISGCLVFQMIYQINDGRIRSFSILGLILGMVIYHYSVSSFWVKSMTLGIKKLIHMIKKIIKLLSRPFCFVIKRVKWIVQFFIKLLRGPYKIVKKALKNILKTVKIALIKK